MCRQRKRFPCGRRTKEYRREASDKLFAQDGDLEGAIVRGDRKEKRIVIMKVSGRVTRVWMFVGGGGGGGVFTTEMPLAVNGAVLAWR